MSRVGELYERLLRARVSALTFVLLVVSAVAYIETAGRETVYVRVLNVLAAGLVPTCLISLLWDFFVKKDFLSYVREQLAGDSEAAHRAVEATVAGGIAQFESRLLTSCAVANAVSQYALRAIHSNRDEIKLGDYVAGARERIWILLTSFSYLTETHLIEELVRRAQAGVSVRLLGLRANTAAAKLRSAFSPTYATLNDEIPIYLNRVLADLRYGEDTGWPVEIRLYDSMPTCACFIIDAELFFCGLLVAKRGRKSVHVAVSQQSASGASQLFLEYERHFMGLFDQAKAPPIPREVRRSRQRVGGRSDVVGNSGTEAT